MDSSSKLHSTKPMSELVSSIINNINIGGSSRSSGRIRSKEMNNLSFEISKYPRDLLRRFLGSNKNINNQSRIGSYDSNLIGNDEEFDDDEESGLNLGLGLSLGGKFGVDKSNNSKGLIRSSSIASIMPLFRGNDDNNNVKTMEMVTKPINLATNRGVSLVRTSSLPVESEGWRKRKEMQTLRRMEAKRRRSEKQRVSKDGGDGGGGGGSGGGNGEKGVESLKYRGRSEREQQSLGITNKFIGNLLGSSTPPIPNNVEVKGRRTTLGSLQGFLIAQGHTQGQDSGPSQGQQGSSQGSGESQGGNSSGASELESKTHQASSICGEARSLDSIQSLQDQPTQESLGSPGTNKPEAESSSKQPKESEEKKRETGQSSRIEDMPCVFTLGDGPSGRKVEGILYRYGKR